jgi:predicted transcriptional regulator
VPTTARAIRVADDLWDAAARIAAERGENLSEIMRAALTQYVEHHAATCQTDAGTNPSK